jgi:hypothetical protein
MSEPAWANLVFDPHCHVGVAAFLDLRYFNLHSSIVRPLLSTRSSGVSENGYVRVAQGDGESFPRNPLLVAATNRSHSIIADTELYDPQSVDEWHLVTLVLNIIPIRIKSMTHCPFPAILLIISLTESDGRHNKNVRICLRDDFEAMKTEYGSLETDEERKQFVIAHKQRKDEMEAVRYFGVYQQFHSNRGSISLLPLANDGKRDIQRPVKMNSSKSRRIVLRR